LGLWCKNIDKEHCDLVGLDSYASLPFDQLIASRLHPASAGQLAFATVQPPLVLRQTSGSKTLAITEPMLQSPSTQAPDPNNFFPALRNTRRPSPQLLPSLCPHLSRARTSTPPPGHYRHPQTRSRVSICEAIFFSTSLRQFGRRPRLQRRKTIRQTTTTTADGEQAPTRTPSQREERMWQLHQRVSAPPVNQGPSPDLSLFWPRRASAPSSSLASFNALHLSHDCKVSRATRRLDRNLLAPPPPLLLLAQKDTPCRASGPLAPMPTG
jgi:hypothetical protein